MIADIIKQTAITSTVDEIPVILTHLSYVCPRKRKSKNLKKIPTLEIL